MPDYSDTASLSQKLMEVTEQLLANAANVGAARQIREFVGDRKKRALALAVRDILNINPEMSATASEMAARGQDGYGEAMKKLRNELQNAETVIAENDALRAQHDSLRSLLSFQRTLTQNL